MIGEATGRAIIGTSRLSESENSVTITATVEDDMQRAVITVIDDGDGVPADISDRIFEPFEKTGAQREEGRSGAGLGLTLVRNIVDLHGGKINLQSTLGQGTVITMTIPLE